MVDPRGVDLSDVVTMADALTHRGPDGEGYAVITHDGRLEVADRTGVGRYRRPQAAVAHRRLTIIDLTNASAQPMCDALGRFALVYNGELYNYVELRRELEAAGRVFRTSGDTEVVLHAWAEWGSGSLERFVGMWAFALLDMTRRELVLCRDRFGIKPLFYAQRGSRLVFASELKGLLASIATPEPDDATVAAFLVSAADTGQQTFFSGVRRVPAATVLTVGLDDPGAARAKRYWDIPDEPGLEDPDAADAFAELFRESVRVHTRSDVAVGTCLSGGLDSSAIVCTASALREAGILPPAYRHQAFGYVPPEEAVSERPWMDLVVRQTGIGFTEVRPSPERFQAALPAIVRSQDEPFGSTSIGAQWFVFEAARQAGMKVMLDGQGADEVLGGYHGYLATIAAGMVDGGRRWAYTQLALDHRRRLGTWPLPAASARALLPVGLQPVATRALARRASRTAPNVDWTMSDVMTERLRSTVPPSDPIPTEMQSLLRHQVRISLPSLLRYEDRNSMAHSIEARVPFLDHRLVEYAFRLTPDAKVRRADTKRLLREAMKGTLPEAIRRRRDKLGFRADPRAAARFAAEHRRDLIDNRTSAEDAWFTPGSVAALIDAAQDDGALEFPLWRVINVKLWARAHWDRGGA